jgi:hypothetical protein
VAKDLPDRRHRLFGREGDLAALAARARVKGLTAVVARPQMGKSWLLTELARRLAGEHEPRHLVGFAESFGETPDLLLRAVVDLYQRWLADAGYWQQAKRVWQAEKPNLLPGVGKVLTKLLQEVPGAGAVEEALSQLVAANRTLATGGIQLPTLTYEQARDLVRAVAELGRRPVALVLDQWEKSPDVGLEAKTLDAFLHRREEWPACHIFMALRPDEPAFGAIERLVRSLPGAAGIHRLEEMELREGEPQRLTAFVRGTVPAALHESDADLLALIEGFPGVLYRWADDYQREHMTSLADLEQVAKDAHVYRFRELEDLLPRLDGDQRRLAIRLALLPAGGGGFWEAIKPQVMDGLDRVLIDRLCFARILEEARPPSYGHAKRAEAARAWWIAKARNKGLYNTLNNAKDEGDPVRRDALLEELRALAGAHPGDAAVRENLAAGLFNTLYHAKAQHDLARRGALLDELRALAAAHPEDAAVREKLAMGLFNTLNHAKAEGDLARCCALLDELRALAAAHPADAAVREGLAVGLFNTLNHAKEEGDLARRDALHAELRALAAAHPADVAVREQLAKGLFNTLYHAEAENDLARRDALLAELRALAAAHPADDAVREQLAKGLFNTLNHAKAEDDLARRDALLAELRALAATHPADAAVREGLAKGLHNMRVWAGEEGRSERAASLSSELIELAGRHPEDEWVGRLRDAGLLPGEG